MANPVWVTEENIKFDGTTSDVVVLGTESGIRTVVEWENLTLAQQQELTDVIDLYDDDILSGTEVAPTQLVVLNSGVESGDATGLSNVATATAGTAVINIGGDAEGTDESGLSSAEGSSGSLTLNFAPDLTTGQLLNFIDSTSGSQTISFGGTATAEGATSLSVGTPATPGSVTIDFEGLATEGATTGLENDATEYTATITVDSTAVPLVIVGSAAQTFGDLLALISIELDTAGAIAIVDGNVVVTSATTGETSTVAIADVDLFESLADFNAIGTPVDGEDAIQHVYGMTVTVDGDEVTVEVDGDDAQTFGDLITAINADLEGAVATLVGGDITITSESTGDDSTILVVDGTLLAALTGFVELAAPVNGDTNANYTATITVDGATVVFSVNPNTVETVGDLITALNTALDGDAIVSISGGDLRITSASVGVTSKIRLVSAGTLLPAVPGYQGAFAPADGGGTARTYSATVEVNGVLVTVAFTGKAGSTIADVITEINADLTGKATASLVNGNIQIATDDTGAGKYVRVYDSGFLFTSLTGYAGITYTTGVAPTTYTATVETVDGETVETYDVEIAGTDAQTYGDLITQINNDLDGDVVATLTTNGIRLASAATGEGTSVRLTADTLFKALADFRSYGSPVAGEDSMVEVFSKIRSRNGALLSEVIPVKRVGSKPAVPPYAKRTMSYVYFDGTVWKYLVDDTQVDTPPAP